MSLVLQINTLASLSVSWSLPCQQQGQPQKPEDKNKETKNRERRQFTNMANILSQLISFSSPSETWRITFSNIRHLLLANIVKNKGSQMTDKQQAYRWVFCIILWCRRSLGCWDGKGALRSAGDGTPQWTESQFPQLCISQIRMNCPLYAYRTKLLWMLE